MPAAAWPVFAGVDFARGRLFDTADVDEARDVCARVFNPHRLSLRGPGHRLRAQMDHLPLGGVSLNRLSWGAPVAVDPDRLGNYYLISLPRSGAARFNLAGQSFDVTPGCGAVVNAAQRFHFEATADFDQVVVRFERAAVEGAWQALSGDAPRGAIDFAVPLACGGPAWRALEPVLGVLVGSIHAQHAGLRHLHARALDLLLTTLLLHQLPAAPAQPPAGAGAPLLRRAQELLLQRLDEPWTLPALARACGAAARTVQAAFQSGCGCGPMQWLRQQRLEAVRAELRAGAARVTDVALRHGFTHLGEFTRAYRLRFGETARETLARHG